MTLFRSLYEDYSKELMEHENLIIAANANLLADNSEQSRNLQDEVATLLKKHSRTSNPEALAIFEEIGKLRVAYIELFSDIKNKEENITKLSLQITAKKDQNYKLHAQFYYLKN